MATWTQTSRYIIEDKEIWVTKTDWNSYPFALIDSIGTGHAAADCSAINGGKCHDKLMARDPWPCPACVPTPVWTELQGSVWVAGADVPPEAVGGHTEQHSDPLERIEALFGVVL